MTNASNTRPAAPVAAAETKPAQPATPSQDVAPSVVEPVTVPVEAPAKAV